MAFAERTGTYLQRVPGGTPRHRLLHKARGQVRLGTKKGAPSGRTAPLVGKAESPGTCIALALAGLSKVSAAAFERKHVKVLAASLE